MILKMNCVIEVLNEYPLGGVIIHATHRYTDVHR